jgi:hypothetical protein
MLRQPAKGDRDRTSPFFTALETLGRRHGESYLPWGSDEGFAAEVGGGYVVAALGGASPCIVPGEDMQHLILLDRQGRLLDRLCCSISNRLTRMFADSGTFRTEVHARPQPDGAVAVIRYTPREGERVAGNYDHEIHRGGRIHTFSWDQNTPGCIKSAEWEAKGLCRVAVQDGKFAIVFPSLERATSRP